MQTDTPPATRLWIDPLIVFMITVGVFTPVLWSTFSVIDDYHMLVNNPMLAPATWEGFKYQLTTPQYHLYSPLTYGILYVLGAVAGPGTSMSPVPFKIASLLLHGCAAVAAWMCIYQLCRYRVAAVLGALVVGLHPLQVESVAWTTGLKDVLCGLLSFVTIALYLHYIDTRQRRFWRLAIVTTVLAMLAKPTATLLPITLAAIDLLFREATWEDRLRRLWPFAAAAAASAAIIVSVQAGQGIERPPLWARPLIAADAHAFYMSKIVWPVDLAIDYTRTPQAIFRSGEIYWTWIFPALVFGGLIATGLRRAWLACVLFVVPVLPVSGLITFDMQANTTVTDHYAYQSMLGVGLVVAMLIGGRRVLQVVSVGVLMTLSVVSVLRLIQWQDNRALIHDNVRKYPSSRLAWEVAASVELLRGESLRAEAMAYAALQRADTGLLYDALSQALEEQGKYEQAAVAAKKCLTRNNKVTLGRARLFLALAKTVNDDELARLAVLKWIELEPHNPNPRQLLRMIDASIARKAAPKPGTAPASQPATSLHD